MKIGIYTPYLDTFGGGERYMLTIAECFSDTHDVEILFDKHLWEKNPKSLIDKLSKTLNLNLSKTKCILAPFGKGSNILNRLFFLRSFNVLFYLTDGSIFLSSAKQNILHFQVPFKNTVGKGLWGGKKLNSWDKVIYNSEFTKKIVEETWPIKGQVIYPPVDLQEFKPLFKKNIILSVGRFFDFLHSKKQEVLVEAFSKMVKNGLMGWTLQLTGGTNKGGLDYLERIKKKARNLPVEFYPDVSFEKLKVLYGHASIYWHGAGFGETDPTKMEHFGISTVEAMAAGCVPIVINLGGQREIVTNKQSGFLWNTLEELEVYTSELIQDKSLRLKMSKKAIERSKIFSKERFCQEIFELISSKKV